MKDNIAYIKKNDLKLLFFLGTVLSIWVLLYFYNKGLVLAYGDSESHINIAKRVISGITPGFGQVGGNWLPLQHLMMVPFVWNDFLWRSGIGGSIVSMLSYIFSLIFIHGHGNGSDGENFPVFM